jgi:mevalonate kinase
MQYHAHGKLLISGEYLVMQGALALAVPCRYGQSLQITEGKDAGRLHWQSLRMDGSVWMETVIDPESLNTDAKKDDSDLLRILKKAVKLSPDFIEKMTGKQAHTQLEFSENWGLGSSSTLVSLVAQWSGADAMKINQKVFGGSGYDIACARSWMPVLYMIDEEGPVWDTVHFLPPQSEQFVFVHLNQKQNSREAIESFKANAGKFSREIHIVSEISEAMLFCDDFADFLDLMDEHEEVMQFVLQEERVQTARFADFPGVVKSLGAWGGDFVLAAANLPAQEIKQYFNSRGFDTVIPYNDMVILEKPTNNI